LKKRVRVWNTKEKIFGQIFIGTSKNGFPFFVKVFFSPLLPFAGLNIIHIFMTIRGFLRTCLHLGFFLENSYFF